jgi:PPOX class probable F420-dependent enzyme
LADWTKATRHRRIGRYDAHVHVTASVGTQQKSTWPGIGAGDRAVSNRVTSTIPSEWIDLVQRPLFASLGTIRPDDTVQVNPMWFDYEDGTLRFTHTTKRAKYRNLQHNPSMSLLITDPDKPMRYLELRGRLAEVIPDPKGDYYVHLGRRYGNPNQTPPPDKADRVVLVMSVDTVSGR